MLLWLLPRLECAIVFFLQLTFFLKKTERERVFTSYLCPSANVILYCPLSENIQTFHTEGFFGKARLHIHIPFLEIMVVFSLK